MTVLFLTLTMIPMMSIRAEAHHKRGPCPIHWQRPYYERHDVRPVATLIRCAVRIWPVPGGAAKALEVARCESGLRPDAYGNGNGGVFQHRLPYWAGRVELYIRDRWEMFRGVYNGRTNVIVSIRMAHAGGWGPWSCG